MNAVVEEWLAKAEGDYATAQTGKTKGIPADKALATVRRELRCR